MSTLFNKPILISDNNLELDNDGSLISGIRLDSDKAYLEIPDLLQKFIDENDENAWKKIQSKIDYIYDGIFVALNLLDKDTSFLCKVKEDVANNKILLFKANLLSPNCIDGVTHKEGPSYSINTKWPFIAALMRWFHDNGNINYSQMALTDGGIDLFSLITKKIYGLNITNEAILEGKLGDFYAGWGFYFVRKYLLGHCSFSEADNPMNGYEESCTGTYLAPGEAKNKMMIYDLNKVQEDPCRKRTIPIPGGKNFTKITLHKILIGGNPDDQDDMKLYPGCVLINVPVLKMHAQDMITNSLKNIGIGLYPSQCANSQDPTDKDWLYASPNYKLPNTKGKLPHSPWVMKIDEKTHLPIKDDDGNYIIKRTDGFSGTQCDLIKGIQSQGTFMIHISDNINIINISHTDGSLAKPISEGFIWTSLDCVALDTFCAAYCFKNLPRLVVKQIQKDSDCSTEFLRKVPIALLSNKQIISVPGTDSPLLRYSLFEYAEARGIGSCSYYIKGIDLTNNSTMASYHGHLIEEKNDHWYELMNETMYFNPVNLLYNMQATVLSYTKACDTLFHSNLYRELMIMLDENHDGVIDYNEKGRGFETAQLEIMAYTLDFLGNIEYGTLKMAFTQNLMLLKNSNPNWNSYGHDFMKERIFPAKLAYAFELSQNKFQSIDLFFPWLIYGDGYWPSYKTAEYLYYITSLYGGSSLETISLASSYGSIFQYCDKIKNSGYYTKSLSEFSTDPNSLSEYFNAIENGAILLPFVFYVPFGFGKLEGKNIPNTIETNDPKLIFTAHIKEIW